MEACALNVRVIKLQLDEVIQASDSYSKGDRIAIEFYKSKIFEQVAAYQAPSRQEQQRRGHPKLIITWDQLEYLSSLFFHGLMWQNFWGFQG